MDWEKYYVEFEDGHNATVEDISHQDAAEQASEDHYVAANYPDSFDNVKVTCESDGTVKNFDVSVDLDPKCSAEEI